MESIAIMAAISIISTLINAYASRNQQNKEFEQQQMLQDDAQQYQSEREDLLFQRNSVPEQFQQMIDAGFNPILAASSIMGGNGTAAASSGSSPSAPTTNSAIGALSNMIGQGGQNLYDLLRNNAEIQNIQADTDKKEVETGIMPRDYQLRMLSTTKQLEIWDASIKRTQQAEKLDKEQTDLIRQQNLYYGRMAESQIKSYESQVLDNYASVSKKLEEINTEKAKQRELDSQSALNYSEVSVNVDEKILLQNQSSNEYYKSESSRIAQEFEKSLGGIPLTADAQKYVQSLVAKCDIEGIKNFYLNIFATAQNQQLGEQLGGMHSHWQLPFGIFQKDYPNSALRTFNNAPIWNMYNYPVQP